MPTQQIGLIGRSCKAYLKIGHSGIRKGSFTFLTFVGDNISNSDMWLLALATLCDMPQIESFLIVLHCPRWPMQVQ